MKFSVLLPTRNRLELLKSAIRSVQNQDDANWEIIVSDNHSDEDVTAYVSSLNDSRIKCVRTSSFVSVTENWNNAMDLSTGEYVIMIGDDDILLKGYFTELRAVIQKYDHPDLIYTSGFTYAYPGAIKEFPQGFLNAYGNASFLQGKNEPFWLSKEEALKVVQDSMNFKVMFSYNMQYAVISRALIEKLKSKGPFFQSPYPDYYTMTAMILNAERLLVCPKPLLVVGISPKSFGAFHFNRTEKQGEQFLKNLSDSGSSDFKEQFMRHVPEGSSVKKLHETLLPGTVMNSFWLLSMEIVKNNFQAEFPLEVNYSRYRLLQIFHGYNTWETSRKEKVVDIKEHFKQLTMREKMTYGFMFRMSSWFLSSFPRRFQVRLRRKLIALIGSHPGFSHRVVNRQFFSIQQVFDEIDPSQFSQH